MVIITLFLSKKIFIFIFNQKNLIIVKFPSHFIFHSKNRSLINLKKHVFNEFFFHWFSIVKFNACTKTVIIRSLTTKYEILKLHPNGDLLFEEGNSKFNC